LENGGNPSICGGLYTYAMEEYGKNLLLKGCSESNGYVSIDQKWFGGRGSHDLKIKQAFSVLPLECKILSVGAA
jgi:hypothetical protein